MYPGNGRARQLLPSVSVLSQNEWSSMLDEAYACLDEEQNHRVRANQIVTLKSDGRELVRQVSPHLQISTELWRMTPMDATVALEIVQEKIGLMKPVYDFLLDATIRPWVNAQL